jgi:catechol 2,3-dioxygenase-like lactoylglutathione lyase family enzyme
MGATITRRVFAGGLAGAGIITFVPSARAAVRGIDHIVINFPDLDKAIRNYTDLGFTVVRGGSNPLGTHNALVALADGAYIEMTAFDGPNPQHRWWAVAQKGGGLIDFCMQSDNVPADTEAFRRTGIEMKIVPGERVRPDRFKLMWTLAQPTPPHAFVAPFLIEDKTPRSERVPAEKGHANGSTGIRALTVAVDDVSLPRQWMSSILGQDGHDMRREEIGARGVSFQIGPHAIEFVMPERTSSPLFDWLKQHGAGPWSVTLKATGGSRVLDESKTGARISLVS